MKKTYFIILALVIGSNFSFGQMVAPDWTLTDCASNSHNLYSILDSQEVVVMEFSHGCASCSNAASYLMNIKAQYDISHPGKVNWFFMDYNGNTCPTVTSMISSFDFDAAFVNCQPQKDNYYPSIFPMPAVVIAAGNYHTVIFQNNTWLNSDTADIKTALDHFFVTVGVENENNTQLNVYPNPVHSTLFVKFLDQSGFRITNMVGQEQKVSVVNIMDTGLLIDVSGLTNGNYILEIASPDRAMRKIFVKN
jgi:hypothetical protein